METKQGLPTKFYIIFLLISLISWVAFRYLLIWVGMQNGFIGTFIGYLIPMALGYFVAIKISMKK